MSNKRIYKKRQKLSTSPKSPSTLKPRYNENDWSQAELILDQLLECNTVCKNGFKLVKHKNESEEIEWMINNLPTLPYVIDNYLNFMFTNKLTTGDEELDNNVLNPFLYKRNAKGVTNYSVLRDSIRDMLLYGKSGIRWLDEENGIIPVPAKRYTSIVKKDTEYLGFNRTVAYAISINEDEPISLGNKPIELDRDEFRNSGRILSKNKDYMVVLPEDFINLRTDTTTENGISKLRQDKQRLELIGNVYQRLNYDIVYDGPGRLIFWMKDNFLNGGDIDVSANEILDQSNATKDLRAERAREEVKKLAQEIKNSSSDNVILGSSYFENKFDHIPRVTKATEFLEYLQMKEGSILAQCIGMTPELIGLGDVSGNVSMEKIIDNAMVNIIIPTREGIATQFSPLLSEKLGLPKVYFDKYEARYNVDRSSESYKYSLAVNSLIQAYQSSVEEGGTIPTDIQNQIMESLKTLTDHIIKIS